MNSTADNIHHHHHRNRHHHHHQHHHNQYHHHHHHHHHHQQHHHHHHQVGTRSDFDSGADNISSNRKTLSCTVFNTPSPAQCSAAIPCNPSHPAPATATAPPALPQTKSFPPPSPHVSTPPHLMQLQPPKLIPPFCTGSDFPEARNRKGQNGNIFHFALSISTGSAKLSHAPADATTKK